MSYGTTRSPAAQVATSDPLLPDEEQTSPRPLSPAASASEDEGPRSYTMWQKTKAFYSRNLGLFFVFLAQIFGSIMSMTTRLLETGFDTKFHALQIIFVRMFVTAVIGLFWMWYKQVPDSPWGPPGTRRLLIIRGAAGSIGLFGLYYSLSYLPVSDATIITFLVPTLTAFVCWVVLSEPYTLHEACAGLIALGGVLFIARPEFLFRNHLDPGASTTSSDVTGAMMRASGGILPPVEATPIERTIAVACAILGAFCAATAYATIRVIGKRAHALVSVNYFAMLATCSSFLIITIHPDLHFELPQTPMQWFLLALIGISGFLLQILLTEGLQREKAGRATNLIYTQLIFSLLIDYFVWGTTPPASSIVGGILIIGAAVWVTLQKKTPSPKAETGTTEEQRSLIGSADRRE